MSQEIINKFVWNDHEYYFDVRDADDSERFENAIANMTEAEKNIPKDGKSSSIIRAQCDMIKKFFDDCFGEGAGNEICTERSRLDLCYDPYVAFLNIVKTQKNYITDKGNTFRQYSNRDQRRHPQNPGQNTKFNNPHTKR